MAAEDESQRYKINNYILETKKVCVATSWKSPSLSMTSSEEYTEFDSQDEDECEELFTGVWSPTVAAQRRQAKSMGKNARN